MNEEKKNTQAKLSFADMTKQQRWVVASTSSGFLLENMDIMFLSFSLTMIIADLGISKAQAGLISTITNLGMLAGGLIFGILGDKLGRVRTFSHTIWIFAIATALTFFAHDIKLLYILRFLAGVGAGGEYGVGMAMIAENFTHRYMGRLTSLAAIGGQVGSILAALLAAWILPAFGWNALYLVGIVPVILIWFVRRHVKESDTFLAAQKQAQEATAHHDASHKISFSRLFATPALAAQTIGLTIMAIIQIAGYFGLMNWLPSIAQARLNLSVTKSSLWMIATIIGMSLGMVVFGWVMDKFGPRWSFGIFLLGSALVMFSLLYVTNMVQLLVAGALIGFFSNGMFGGYGTVISLLYPTEIRSTANNMIMNIGRAVGGFSSLAIGAMMDAFNNLWIVMGSLAGMYVVSFLVMVSLPGIKRLTALKSQARKGQDDAQVGVAVATA